MPIILPDYVCVCVCVTARFCICSFQSYIFYNNRYYRFDYDVRAGLSSRKHTASFTYIHFLPARAACLAYTIVPAFPLERQHHLSLLARGFVVQEAWH